jgi:hypothetical protein
MMEGWRNAVEGSRAHDLLEALRDNEAEDEQARQHARYLIEYRETWARSYAQYIANHSGSVVLRSQLANIRSYTEGTFAYWEDDDFAPIDAAIHSIFEAKGWLHQ